LVANSRSSVVYLPITYFSTATDLAHIVQLVAQFGFLVADLRSAYWHFFKFLFNHAYTFRTQRIVYISREQTYTGCPFFSFNSKTNQIRCFVATLEVYNLTELSHTQITILT
jgi:hypothetical protein